MTNKNSKNRIRLDRKNIDEINNSESQKKVFESPKPIKDSSNPFQENTGGSTLNNSDQSLEDLNNPFEESNSFPPIDDEPVEQESWKENSPPPTEDHTSSSNATNIELDVDSETPYFFVFGNSTAGKSAMLSGLLYYIKTSGIGQLRSLSINDYEHHRKGDYILSQMTKKVRKGEFIEGTQTLDTTDFVFPTEINLEFEPNDKPNMPFCLLEMAGEDLKEIELRDEGKTGGEFDKRINAYLKHPKCKMIFICVVDVDTPENSEDLIDAFLRYTHKIGHKTNPVLISINKWDKVADQYENAKDYIEKEVPILKNHLFDTNRNMAYMKFSIGDVISNNTSEDTYNYKPNDSEKLLKWMYQTAMGVSLDQEITESALSKFFASIKNLFSK